MKQKAKEHFLQVEDKQLREVLLSNLEKYPNSLRIENMVTKDYDTPEQAVNSFRWASTNDGCLWRQVHDTNSFQPYFDKYGESEGGTCQPAGDVIVGGYDTPPTPKHLDEVELREKASEIGVNHYGLSKLTDKSFNCMLDFAKYYHSIQAKEEVQERDKEIGLLRDEVIRSLEGKYVVFYDATMPRYDSFEEAVQRAKGKNDKRLQIFKLVAEVEKVTTINVKEV